MKKILVLILTLLSSTFLSSVYSLCIRRKDNKEVRNVVSLSLYSSSDTMRQRRWIHTSHASHYSCVNGFKHSVEQTKIKDIILDSTQIAGIKSLWEWKNEKGSATLQKIEAESVHLDSIDGFYTNGEYIKLYFLIRFLKRDDGDVDMQSHQYYIYYISKDKDLYYLYREEAPSRTSAKKLKEFPILKQTIDIIKE